MVAVGLCVGIESWGKKLGRLPVANCIENDGCLERPGPKKKKRKKKNVSKKLRKPYTLLWGKEVMVHHADVAQKGGVAEPEGRGEGTVREEKIR